MKRLLGGIVVAMVFVLTLSYWGNEYATETTKQVFRYQRGRKLASAPKSRMETAIARNTLADMAMKVIPEPQGVPTSTVLSDDEAAELRETFISSHANLDAAKDYLLNETPSWKFDKANERYRVITLLTTAIGTPNPEMPYALERVSEVILTDNYDTYGTRMQRTMALADRGYLFTAMLKYHPERAHELLDKARGTRTGRILEFAYGSFRKRNPNS